MPQTANAPDCTSAGTATCARFCVAGELDHTCGSARGLTAMQDILQPHKCEQSSEWIGRYDMYAQTGLKPVAVPAKSDFATTEPKSP
jgi:hypothetical protein